MIEPVLHFSIGAHPNQDQLRNIETARELHPGWQVKVWQDPVETTGFLLAKYHTKAQSGSQLADLIRLDAVYSQGGVYLDSDVRLIRPLDELCVHKNFFCSEDGYNLTNAVFGATKQSPVIKALIDKLLAEEPDWSDKIIFTTGPAFFARVLQWRQDVIILPRESFYPYNFNEPPCLPLHTSYGVHEWAGSWVPTEQKHKVQSAFSFSTGISAIKRTIKGFLKQMAVKYGSTVERGNKYLGPSPGGSYSFGTDLIVKTSRGFLMSLSGDDLSITPEIALSGTYEEPELRFIQKTLRGGDFFVDVGCNVGVFTLLAARSVGPFGRVFSFDPNCEVILHLRRSLVMNWVHDRVKVFECAVGQVAETATLRYSRFSQGGGNLGKGASLTFDRTVEGFGDVVERETRTVMLDRVFPHDIEIKILKIDVEGFEHSVLAGAQRLLRERSVRFLILELLEEVASEQHPLNVRAVHEVIDYGYRVCRVDATGQLVRCSSVREATNSSRNLVLERL